MKLSAIRVLLWVGATCSTAVADVPQRVGQEGNINAAATNVVHPTDTHGMTNAPIPPTPWQINAVDLVHPEGFPAIGKWMLDAQKEPAHWLGEKYRGRSLREPINVLIVDDESKSPAEARDRLLRNLREGGFPVREGHSTGYLACIDGFLYSQIPEGKHVAFSDEPTELGNNHGRVFGPHPFRNAWVFVAAFSRERLAPLDSVKHRYVSFDRARDTLAQELDLRTDYRIKGYVRMDNAVIGDAEVSTGDHDGIAVLLRTVTPKEGESRVGQSPPAPARRD